MSKLISLHILLTIVVIILTVLTFKILHVAILKVKEQSDT